MTSNLCFIVNVFSVIVISVANFVSVLMKLNGYTGFFASTLIYNHNYIPMMEFRVACVPSPLEEPLHLAIVCSHSSEPSLSLNNFCLIHRVCEALQMSESLK